jgi:hypothetical protein
VGVDFSTKDLFQTQFIAASREYKKNHDTETVISLAGDTSYVDISGQEQLNLEFTIKASPGTGLKNSYFLAGNGYYHDNSLFEGKARLAELSRFTGKGAFDKYSREKFDGLFNVISDNGKNETVTIK